MLLIARYILAFIAAFSSGVVIAGGVFSFIAIIGVVPRMAQRTSTEKNIVTYENAIILGGILGSLTMVFDFKIPLGIISVIPSFGIGVFVGAIAVSIAEVLDVVPVFMRRASLKKGLELFVWAIALGKTTGALLYFIFPYFS